MSDYHHKVVEDVADIFLRVAPAAGAWALSPSTVVALATLFYIGLQCAYTWWKWNREAKQRDE